MPKQSKRKKEYKKTQVPELASNANWLKYIPVIIALSLAIIPFTMGKYIEFNSPGPFDSASNVYSAKHVLDGAKIGVEEIPSAALATLLVNMLGVWLFGFGEFGPKLIQMLFQLSAFGFMLYTLWKTFGKLAAFIGVIVASVYLSSPLIAKFGNVKEQFMAAVMVIGICFFMLRQNGGKWWLCLLSGSFLAWAPLFKQTGLSSVGAVGLFWIIQPLVKNRTWKQSFQDLGLLIAGAVIALLPAYIWLIVWHDGHKLPYKFLWDMLPFASSDKKIGGTYIANARKLSDLGLQAQRVFRYYWMLILPIGLALSSIIIRAFRLIKQKLKAKSFSVFNNEKFVLLLAVWWILDMIFVWISPRSYEQYYIPLNASAAMLGSYIVGLYIRNFTSANNKIKWLTVGVTGSLLMILASWHIFFGIETSPHSGQKYPNKRRGFAQRIDEVKKQKAYKYQGGWEKAGDYIKANSSDDDKIWVWGWVPGIYVQSQKLSPTTKPFMSEMHVRTPEQLRDYVDELLADFNKEKPEFLVDTHKVHFPWNRPPLELWPSAQKRLLPNNPQYIAKYEAQYEKMLKEKIGNEEDLRFKAMKPLRDFVMTNYRPVEAFGKNMLFQLKNK